MVLFNDRIHETHKIKQMQRSPQFHTNDNINTIACSRIPRVHINVGLPKLLPFTNMAIFYFHFPKGFVYIHN